MTPEELRAISNASIAESVKALNNEKRLQEELEWKKQQEYQEVAQSIIATISTKCEKEARKGKFEATVMNLKYLNDYVIEQTAVQHLRSTNSRKAGIYLVGVAEIVWNYCNDAGLNPIIQSWHDGVGERGGYKLEVCWADSK